METTNPASVPTFSFPFALDCHNYYELMVAHGEGRSPMASSDAETDSKPIIINIIKQPFSEFQIVLKSAGYTRIICQIGLLIVLGLLLVTLHMCLSC